MVGADIDRSGPRRLIAVAILFLCLTSVAVALRVYSRIVLTHSLGLDDKLTCLLQAVFIAFLVAEILGTMHGIGIMKGQVSPGDIRKALQYIFAHELLYIFTTVLLKASIGAFLLRIAIAPTHIWTLRGLVLLTLLIGVMAMFSVILQCRPVHIFWDESPLASGHCWDTKVVEGAAYATAALNCLLNWAFGVVLPLVIVWSVEMRTKTKILFAILLSFASIASIATVIRLMVLSSVDFGSFLDTSCVALWSTVEPGIGIIASCLPVLHPLMTDLFGRREGPKDTRQVWWRRWLRRIITTGVTMPKRFSLGSTPKGEPPAWGEAPRLRFDDFAYELEISGPKIAVTRPPPLWSRASWAFSLRTASRPSFASGASSAASESPDNSKLPSNSGGPASPAPSEVPLWGIMRTMQFELSYEDRTWAGEERMTPQHEDCPLTQNSCG